MAPKAVDARKRFDRNQRFRGHGPLLQKKAWPALALVAHPRGMYNGPSPCSCSTRTPPHRRHLPGHVRHLGHRRRQTALPVQAVMRNCSTTFRRSCVHRWRRSAVDFSATERPAAVAVSWPMLRRLRAMVAPA
jgi:hypothetical protein